jgi:P27 family predicted phage terminase small subunit
MPKGKRAPQHLKEKTRAWWRAVVNGYELEPHHVRLLTLAAEAWDRGQDARELVATEGAVYRDRFDQPRAHPAVAIERDARLAFARLLRELDLDVEPPTEGPRPPALQRFR